MWLRLRKSNFIQFFLEWEIRVVQHRKTLRPRTIPVTVSVVWNHQDWVDSKRTGFWNVAKSKTINEAAFRTLNFELYMKLRSGANTCVKYISIQRHLWNVDRNKAIVWYMIDWDFHISNKLMRWLMRYFHNRPECWSEWWTRWTHQRLPAIAELC